MITGTVTDEGVPVIELELAGRNWKAVIDTGFNGDVELPAELRSQLQCRYLGRFKSFLAAGKIVEEPAYQTELSFDGEPIVVTATFVPGDEILLGTRLLQFHRLEIDFPERTVKIERA